jgi:flagellar hook-associated protein 3 FlgL
MDRIASFSHQSRLVQNMMQAEVKVAKAQLQQSSQLESTTYAGIADQTSQLVNLQAYLARSERYADEGEIVSSRITATHKAVGSMIDIADQVKGLVTSLSGSAASVPSSVAEQARGLMEDFAVLLNTQLGGRYLFAGGATGTAPVSTDSAVYPAATYPSAADTSYYSGDDTVARFRADDDLTVEYGVTANDPDIEKVMRALNLLANMPTDPVDTDLVNEAYALADEGSEGLTTVQTKLGSAADTVENAIDRHVDEQLTLQSQIEDITKVDLAAMSARLSQLEALLEASAQVITVMKAFNLNDLL